MEGLETTLFLLMQVPKLQSGGLVEELALFNEVREVAALCGEIDVIAYIEGHQDSVANAMWRILNKPMVTRTEVLSCEQIHRNWSSLERDPKAPDQVVSFVVIHIDRDMVDSVIKHLLDMTEVKYVARMGKPHGILLAEIITTTKSCFDETIMTKIQSITGVNLTRSYITINSMHHEKPTDVQEIADIKEATSAGKIPRAKATEKLGELYACSQLGLKQMPTGTKGADAIGGVGTKYQIKSRAPSDKPRVNPAGRIGTFHNFDFDYALLVLLDSSLKLDEIWKANRDKVRLMQEKEGSRGIHVGSFIRQSEKVYPISD